MCQQIEGFSKFLDEVQDAKLETGDDLDEALFTQTNKEVKKITGFSKTL